MTAKLPALFVSHGAPSLIMDPCPTRDFLRGLGKEIGRPRAILSVSAHWTTQHPRVTGHPQPPTIHDFGGFSEDLYRLEYPAPGDPVLAKRVLDLLRRGGIEGERDLSRGYDHGAWVPLMLMYPEADIPVVQLSVQPQLGPGYHLELGQALKPLREEGVLVVASGATTHNLGDFFGRRVDTPPLTYARAFAEWVQEAVCAGRTEELVDYAKRAPQALHNHPSPEHFLPIFVALGSGGGGAGRILHDGYTYGAFSMAAFAWD